MGLIELLIVAGVGVVAFGAYKTGALQKIYTGILGRVDQIAEKVKDPIVELQLKQANLVEYSGKVARLATEVGGKKSQLAATKDTVTNELSALVPEYEKQLAELKAQSTEDQIPADKAQALLMKKNIIDLKNQTLTNTTAREAELAQRFEELRGELSTVNAQLELVSQLIESANIDRDVLRLRGDEINGLLSGELNVDKLVNDIKSQTARMEGEIDAANILKSDIKKTPTGTISIASLELA